MYLQKIHFNPFTFLILFSLKYIKMNYAGIKNYLSNIQMTFPQFVQIEG